MSPMWLISFASFTGASIPMGQRGHVIWTGGDIIRNVPLNISGVISATFYPYNILLISWKSYQRFLRKIFFQPDVIF